MSSPQQVLAFMHLVERLKTTKRTGWIEHDIRNPESISDHMHRMSLLGLLLDDPSLDRQRCALLSIVHDVAECIVGDITPHSETVSKEEKARLELAAMTSLVQDTLGGSVEALFLQELWVEYENASSLEAQVVKELDKLEMIIQALEYERREGRRLDSFFESTKGKFTHPQVLSWVNAVYEERQVLHKNL